MDTSAETITTDSLGWRNSPRRKYSITEKRAMVEETQRRGASVSEVAQRHGVNANMLFSWRRLYQRGLLQEADSSNTPALLPVKVSTPTLLPGERTTRKERGVAQAPDAGAIEIEFSGGPRLQIRGPVDQTLLLQILAALSRR